MNNNDESNIDNEGITSARGDRAELATARSNVYGLLATVFRAELSKDSIKKLQDPGLVKLFAGLGVSFGDDLLKTPDDQLDQLEEDLAVEFTRLFLGPGKHISAHESIFVEVDGDSGGLWGKATVKVKKFIETAGLEYESAFTGLPDHISVELEFMEQLCRREADVWNEDNQELALDCLKIQRKFFVEHLDMWAGTLCDKVTEEARLPFYKEVADLTKAFLDFERESLDEYVASASA